MSGLENVMALKAVVFGLVAIVGLIATGSAAAPPAAPEQAPELGPAPELVCPVRILPPRVAPDGTEMAPARLLTVCPVECSFTGLDCLIFCCDPEPSPTCFLRDGVPFHCEANISCE